jgi:ABC-type multidrug transport system fused ATPase/permease subunit
LCVFIRGGKVNVLIKTILLDIFNINFLVGYARMNTSKKLHAGLLKNVLRSPMNFFDTTPVGRIVSRFSNDVAKIDNDIFSIYIFLPAQRNTEVSLAPI